MLEKISILISKRTIRQCKHNDIPCQDITDDKLRRPTKYLPPKPLSISFPLSTTASAPSLSHSWPPAPALGCGRRCRCGTEFRSHRLGGFWSWGRACGRRIRGGYYTLQLKDQRSLEELRHLSSAGSVSSRAIKEQNEECRELYYVRPVRPEHTAR